MPAADGELAALLGPLDPLVAGERQRSASPSRPGSAPTASRIGSGRAAAGGAPSASAVAEAQTSPPRREDVERAGPLADEVRRRLEAGAPADTAARQQRDALRAEEPAGRLGGVAGVGVLGQEAHEAPLELLVQRREQQRQHRLGDARSGGQGGRERLQALERAAARGRMHGVPDGP